MSEDWQMRKGRKKPQRPRVCKYCGSEAYPKEKGIGFICPECYRKKRREAYHRQGGGSKNQKCKICGEITRSESGICWKCRYTQPRNITDTACRIYPDYDFSKESEIKRWNREHPLHPGIIAGLHEALQNYFDDCQPSGYCRGRHE